MPRPIVEVETHNDSNMFPFLFGAFDLPGWTIPYVSVVMPFKDAAEDLLTTFELPQVDQNEWTIEELFQRDLNWTRVDSDIVPYLRNPAEPAFFPSLTVALLPYDRDDKVQLENFDDWEGFLPPRRWDEPEAFQRVEQIGPITLGWYNPWDELTDPGAIEGQIRWNREQIKAIAIDGQHRLAAIKRLFQAHPRDLPKFRNARQPANILIFDRRLGFAAPDGMENRSLKELIRQLFIDLNKHAVKVSRERMILLEDLEPHARCVRRLLTNGIRRDIASLTEPEPRLPLSLVDWHSENSKFNTGPYVTSVITLDWIVAKILGRKVVGDFTKYSALKSEFTALKRSLGVDLQDAKARIGQNENDQIPFSYKAAEIDLIHDEFGRLFPSSVCYLLSQFEPYVSLIGMRCGDGTFGLEFQHWYFLRSRRPPQGSLYGVNSETEYQEWLLELLARPGARTETEFEQSLSVVESFKQDNLAFNIAFQRAYFLAWLEFKEYKEGEKAALEGRREIDIDDLAFDEDQSDLNEPLSDEEPVKEEEEAGSALPSTLLSAEAELKNSTVEFVSAMNSLVNGWGDALWVAAIIPPAFMSLGEDREGLSGWFWGGSLYDTANQSIDFTESASNRAKDLLFLIVAMITYDTRKEPNTVSEFDEFWDEVIREDGSKPSPFIRRVRRAVSRQVLDEGSKGFAARILQQQEEPYDLEKARMEIELRLKFIWKTLGL